ncbi:MAG: ABC transporter ATP-binding protein [Bacillaceae bacterium]|nr:ABC transporter ATP-binding protein [Bacillaceae bacterium]
MFLSIHDLSKSFTKDSSESLLVLKDINLGLKEGEFVSLLGPSGCGKSTLLSIVAGLTKPTKGSVMLEGSDITKPGPDRGVVFQEAALFPWMNVRENIMFPLRNKKMSKQGQKERVEKFLKMVHLSQFADSYPHELSGGMQQRVSIARALAMDPKVLLMDEPFGALDEQTRNVMHEELEKIWVETKKTILFVTHSIREAIKLSDRVIVMGTRPGSIIFDMKVDLDRPRSRDKMVALEQQIMNILKKEIDKVMKEELSHAGHS